MTTLLHVPQTDSAGLIRFACGHCGTPLEVPLALAGVAGPCPVCSGEITAPPAMMESPAHNGAQLLTKPPPRRDLPPPLAPVDETGESRDPGILPVSGRRLPAGKVEGPPARVGQDGLQPVGKDAPGHAPAGSAVSLTGRVQRLFPVKQRGIFDDTADSAVHRLDIQQPARTFRRRGWRRWLDIGIVSVFTGLLVAVVVALRFTVPLEVKSVPGLPENLTELVALESKNMKLREREAGELARAAVSRYLGAGSEQAAGSHLLPPPDGIASPPFPPFAGPMPGEYRVQWQRRIAGTDRYVVVVEPNDKAGPVFVVEQTESGPRLYAGAITQQSANLFEKFIATPGEGEATLYVKVKPTAPGEEREYRARRPDLAEFLFVDAGSAFPVNGPGFIIACIKPGSDAARSFSSRAHDPGWRSALVQLRWMRHREAGPYAELVNFIPGPWSGEPALPPPGTATAATTP